MWRSGRRRRRTWPDCSASGRAARSWWSGSRLGWPGVSGRCGGPTGPRVGCVVCGAPVTCAWTGRPARYCSAACRTRAWRTRAEVAKPRDGPRDETMPCVVCGNPVTRACIDQRPVTHPRTRMIGYFAARRSFGSPGPIGRTSRSTPDSKMIKWLYCRNAESPHLSNRAVSCTNARMNQAQSPSGPDPAPPRRVVATPPRSPPGPGSRALPAPTLGVSGTAVRSMGVQSGGISLEPLRRRSPPKPNRYN